MPPRQGGKLPPGHARILPNVAEPVAESLPGLLNLVGHGQLGLQRSWGVDIIQRAPEVGGRWLPSAVPTRSRPPPLDGLCPTVPPGGVVFIEPSQAGCVIVVTAGSPHLPGVETALYASPGNPASIDFVQHASSVQSAPAAGPCVGSSASPLDRYFQSD